MKRYFILIFIILFASKSYSQNLKTIESMEKSYQLCLDEGIDMHGCASHYYKQSDSILNVVYKKLRLKLNAAEKNKLKTEQLTWLKKRDKYFENEYSKLKKENLFEEGSRDFEMIYYDKKSEFVMERVKELINRI